MFYRPKWLEINVSFSLPESVYCTTPDLPAELKLASLDQFWLWQNLLVACL